MKVPIYARVSTTNHGQDVGLQTWEQHQFADARGWQVYKDYIDQGSVGAKIPDQRKIASWLTA